jgi:chromate transporter
VTFVGNQVAGIPGALLATFGVILPSCIFVTVLAYVYNRYRKLSLVQGVLGALRPAVVAMIFSAGLRILIPAMFKSGAISLVAGNLNIRILIYFLIALFVLRKWKLGPIKVMVSCGVAELIVQIVQNVVR